MHDLLTSTPFELTGVFGGFVFTGTGKRRMLLRVRDGQDCLLKVPRLLRRRLVGKFRPGAKSLVKPPGLRHNPFMPRLLSTRDRFRRTLAQEFRDSFRAGPRAWGLTLAIFVGFAVFPFLGVLALACVALLVVPAVFGKTLGRLAATMRDARTLRRLERAGR